MTSLKATPQFLAANPRNWSTTSFMSQRSATCNGCGQSDLYWSWDWRTRRSELVDKYRGAHRYSCASPPKKVDIFPGWCLQCNVQELYWIRKDDGYFELTEAYGLPHSSCTPVEEPNNASRITEISKAKCKYCKTTGLYWVQTSGKFKLTMPSGQIHSCQARTAYSKDWAEALRFNYAFEKKWIKSIPDDKSCKRCQGIGHKTFYSNSKRIKAKYGTTIPVQVSRPCRHCKTIGKFSAEGKAAYLKELRKKYWPFKNGIHKWKSQNV